MRFKVGDKVKVIKSLYGHGLEIGRIYEIGNIIYDEYNKPQIKIDGWSLKENEVEFAPIYDLTLKEIFDLWNNGDETIEDKLEDIIDFWKLDDLLKEKYTIPEGTKVKIINTHTCWDGFYGKVCIYDEEYENKPYEIVIDETDYSDKIYLYMSKDNLEVIYDDN